LIASLLPSPTGRGTEVTNDLAGVVGQPSQMASSSISEGATVATDTSLTLALMEQLAIRLSPQADKSLVISQGARGQGQNPSNVPFPTLPLGGMSLALEEQLAIRLGEQTTPAKSLVIRANGC
ncbi:MAG: hypothetical protein HOO95_08180, partial [Gallionella sp.]|nr:hypothetical protein [Gallionella sp.]